MVKQQKIMLKLVIYPSHALSFEQAYQCGTRQMRWNVLKQIAALVEREGDGRVEVWDFEGYHPVGTETISDAPSIYWQDPEHFNYEMGNMMLDEMFGLKPPQLGVKLTSSNIAARANVEQQARSEYLNAHPEFLPQLQKLLPRP